MSVRLIVARQTHVAAAQMTDAENDKVTAGAVATGQIYQRVGSSGQRCHRPDKNGYCNSDGNQYAQDLLHDCSPVLFCSPPATQNGTAFRYIATPFGCTCYEFLLALPERYTMSSAKGGKRCSGVCATCPDPCPTGLRLKARRESRQL